MGTWHLLMGGCYHFRYVLRQQQSLDMQDYEKSIKKYHGALRLAPKQASLWEGLAAAYFKTSKFSGTLIYHSCILRYCYRSSCELAVGSFWFNIIAYLHFNCDATLSVIYPSIRTAPVPPQISGFTLGLKDSNLKASIKLQLYASGLSQHFI